MTPTTAVFLLKGLDLLILGLEMAPHIRVAFANVTVMVETMVTEERDPTTTEWAELTKLSSALHERIQEAHPDVE